jgi:hypothetical protein
MLCIYAPSYLVGNVLVLYRRGIVVIYESLFAPCAVVSPAVTFLHVRLTIRLALRAKSARYKGAVVL